LYEYLISPTRYIPRTSSLSYYHNNLW
jgi:hypothetical protein